MIIFVVVTCFFAYHVYLLCNGYTTIEFCEKRRKKSQEIFSDRSPYDHGIFNNIKGILGDSPILWFFPICNAYNINKIIINF